VPTWLIIVLVVLLLLVLGGMIARAMYQRRTEAQFRAQLEQANHDLAEAAALDRGWDRETLEAAARRCLAEKGGGAQPGELLLVEVLDRPGTEEDEAVFRVGDRLLRLGRRGDEWVFAGLE
jgi:Tfp pilus assembly protein PilX